MNTGAPIIETYDWKPADSYLKKIKQAVMAVPKIDSSHCQIQFVFYEGERKFIRVRPFGVSELSTVAVSDVLSTCRSNVSQPPEILIPDLSTTVLAHFEDLLNHRYAAETDFQKFFESHPFLLTAFEFKKAHAQPILYKDDGGVLIPDFFLEKLSPGWDAVLDIKRPYDEMVMRRLNRLYFRQYVQNAIGQLQYYREWFNSPSNRKRFSNAYGTTAYRPKMVIVIGRNHHFRDDVERVRLMEMLPPQLEIRTYDDLLNRAKRYLGLVRSE